MTKNSDAVDDYQHAIAEIRRCLHSDKAAVLVGAGFSRNARPIGNHTRSFPDWKGLTLDLADRLYPDNKRREDVVREAGATSAALRLAQEFEVAFGRSALLDLVRDTVRDRDYEPGPLHCELLELPWADIFTTNYDTLLERAGEAVWRRKYDVVESVGDLPIARRPRIVKLHGSLPGLRDLVLTEDDYRQYPGRYAPLVNAVRGSLSENIFCLIGFSGTDPNFLAWTGWIRDELQASTPYVYLFTADDLTPFQRRLLEDRRIIPIPIGDLAGQKKSFSQAYAWLFDALRFPPGPPTPSWNIRPRYVIREADPSIADEPWNRSGDGTVQWVDTATIWRRHRLQYKGWHVLHRDGIERIWTSTEFWLRDLSPKVVAGWSPAEAVFILSELVWRCARALVPLPDNVVFEILDPALARYGDWRADLKEDETSLRGTAKEVKISLKELDIAALRIRLELLRHAREIGMGTRFKQIEQEVCFCLKTAQVPEIPDATQFVEQQGILLLLAQFNHDEARTRLAKWDTTTADPIWSVRKAGLCLECGLRDEGPQLVFSVLGSIRRSGLSRETDVRMLSVEGLALFLGWYVHHSKEFSKLLTKSARSTPDLDTTGGSRDFEKPDESATASDAYGQDGQINIQDTVERLHELQDYGCDPNLLLDWLTLVNDGEPSIPNNVTKRLSFDLSWLISHSSGRHDRLERAYRAIRFIEEAGLPLRIERRSGVLVAEKLFSAASRTIAQFAPHEALGLVLRSSDEKLLEEVLSRGCIAQLNQEQVAFLLGAGRSSLEHSLAHLRPTPRPREMEDDWWGTQFAAACIVLGRAAVRLDGEQLRALADGVLDLPHDKRILARISGPKELATLIRRICESMRRRTYEALLPRLLGTPLLGSDRLPNAPPRLVGDWYDPVGAISLFPRERWDRSSIDVAGDIETLIDIVARQTGEWRKNAILRMLALRAAGLLCNGDERRFVEALYARTDPFGLPSDTGCYDSVVLGFPRVHKVPEIGMFRSKYISSELQGENYWDELRRTVSRFGLPRGRDGRSIPWTRGDLAIILDRAEAWLDASQSVIKPARTTDHPFRQWHQDSNQARYAAWLDVIEDVVLLAGNVTADLCERAARLLKRAEESGLNSIKTAATLGVLGLVEEPAAVSAIKRSLGSRDERDVWQACCAIARWCEHTRAARDPVIPPALLSALSNTISTRRHEKLALLVNTAKDVVDTVPISDFPVGFFDELASGLSELFAETDYTSSPFQQIPFSTESQIRLRMVAARLAHTLLAQGFDSSEVRQCVEAASRDTFPEVRREVDDE